MTSVGLEVRVKNDLVLRVVLAGTEIQTRYELGGLDVTINNFGQPAVFRSRLETQRCGDGDRRDLTAVTDWNTPPGTGTHGHRVVARTGGGCVLPHSASTHNEMGEVSLHLRVWRTDVRKCAVHPTNARGSETPVRFADYLRLARRAW